MNDKDILSRFLFENADVRGEIVRLDDSFQAILQQHSYPQFIRNLLGEVAVVAALLTATVKLKGRLTVQFRGPGKLKLLLAQCTHQGHLRGLAQWEGDLNSQEIAESLQQGVLAIMLDPEHGQRYQAVVAWQGNSIAESIEGYFRDSEQLATRLWLAVDDQSAAGLLLQVMPQEGGKLRPVLGEYNAMWEHLVHLAATISMGELLTLDFNVLLRRLFVNEEVRLFVPQTIQFRCTCSQKRSEHAVLLLGREEAEEELQEKQSIVVTCEFCNHEYVFDRVDVARIFSEGDASQLLH